MLATISLCLSLRARGGATQTTMPGNLCSKAIGDLEMAKEREPTIYIYSWRRGSSARQNPVGRVWCGGLNNLIRVLGKTRLDTTPPFIHPKKKDVWSGDWLASEPRE
jgi:hypothetical protein